MSKSCSAVSSDTTSVNREQHVASKGPLHWQHLANQNSCSYEHRPANCQPIHSPQRQEMRYFRLLGCSFAEARKNEWSRCMEFFGRLTLVRHITFLTRQGLVCCRVPHDARLLLLSLLGLNLCSWCHDSSFVKMFQSCVKPREREREREGERQTARLLRTTRAVRNLGRLSSGF